MDDFSSCYARPCGLRDVSQTHVRGILRNRQKKTAGRTWRFPTARQLLFALACQLALVLRRAAMPLCSASEHSCEEREGRPDVGKEFAEARVSETPRVDGCKNACNREPKDEIEQFEHSSLLEQQMRDALDIYIIP
jgi:hypothetical protein